MKPDSLNFPQAFLHIFRPHEESGLHPSLIQPITFLLMPIQIPFLALKRKRVQHGYTLLTDWSWQWYPTAFTSYPHCITGAGLTPIPGQSFSEMSYLLISLLLPPHWYLSNMTFKAHYSLHPSNHTFGSQQVSILNSYYLHQILFIYSLLMVKPPQSFHI